MALHAFLRTGCATSMLVRSGMPKNSQHIPASRDGDARGSLCQGGRLLFAPTPPSGCVLRRTPILAWALLSMLERHPDVPDVAVMFNCRDKPTYWLHDVAFRYQTPPRGCSTFCRCPWRAPLVWAFTGVAGAIPRAIGTVRTAVRFNTKI